MAEIVVSSALFGGIAAEGRLEGISESIFKRSYRLGDEHFIDIALPVGNREGVFRWFPDPVSSRLILGWYESHHESSETSKHEVRRAIRDALAFLGVRVTRPYSTLAKLSMQAGKIELPGSVAAVFRGEIPAVSYPLAQYVRLQLELPLIGKDGALSRADKDDLKESERVWLPVIENNAVGKGGFERLAGRCLKGWIKEIKNAPFSGNERRDRKCKRLLAAKIKAELEVESGWSSLGLALAGWAVYLCESGTRWKKNLAFSTIEKYIQMVARVLEEVTGEKDFLYLSELEYEDSYLRALHYVQKRRRAALAGRLYEFHRFLGDQYAVEEPSWSAIMATAGLTQVTEYPSANALAENEYERIITHIIEDSALTERVRTQYAWLLLLCYRFGLRFGEALRVGRNHVQCSDDCERLTILVVSSMYGQTKTHAGERVVTQHEVLLDSEKKIVGAVMRLAASRLAEETPVLMAGEYGQYRKPISRSRAASYLSHCLKWSTGDHNLTLHHLRHGWVGRRVCDIWPALSAGSEGLETSVQADRLLDWRDAYPLKTLSVKVGHEQETTALGSYCHVLDKVGASFMNRLAPSLRASEEAYCLQLPLSTIRRRYERRKGEEQGLLKENARVAKRIPMPPIQVARVATAIPVYKSVKTSDRKPLTLVEIDGLLKRASNCGLSSERLARMLVLPEHRVERAIKKALELVRLTGFDRYQLHRHVKELIGKDVHRYVESGQQLYRLESRRFTEALNQAQKHVIEPGSGESAHYVRYLDIWARTYTPKTGGNLITDFEELDAIGQLMISLFHKPRFILRGEEALLKSEKIVAWSERNGARIQKNKKQKAIEKVRHRAVNCIELRSEECIPYTQTRELARYLFILSIYYDQLCFEKL
ncbi:hypothetical protein [uncultured Spongiibacter sp.]|uniref:hypothetical protein n=1 Tax=uncultured Spongiibacter sp. TaxID=870896 RepID=UPI002591AA58|nr:hypothetical protein [uncultured Spongiibacter sp.]